MTRYFHASGLYGNIVVTIKSESPVVTCVDARPGTVPSRQACRGLTDILPIGLGDSLIFGNRGQSGVDVALPLEFLDGRALRSIVLLPPFLPQNESWHPAHVLAMVESGDCYSSVVTRVAPELGSWYDLWATAIAIEGMCIRIGRNGKAVFGESAWIPA